MGLRARNTHFYEPLEKRERHADRGYHISELISFGIGGVALVIGVAFTGHYLGQKANASAPNPQWSDVVSPASTIVRKASLLNVPTARTDLELVTTARQDPDVVRPVAKASLLSTTKSDLMIQPVIVQPEQEQTRVPTLLATPTVWQIERTWEIGRERKKQIMAQRKERLAQQSCLSRAIYFEARSETELGQLAVAKVILNRVRDRNYPNTICGVVYEGSHRKNSCQFSFACDGLSDKPKAGKSWRQAKRIAQRAMISSSNVKVISTATHYHADYVRPKWSSTMKRLIKIGRHIFYRES